MIMESIIKILAILALIYGASCTATSSLDFYSLTAKDIQGNEMSLEQYKGMISLVVNVASECGYTDHNYRELVSLQEDYHSFGFNVLAFPCNQFGEQEPASNEEILKFAKEKHDVNFPMFAKVDVKGEQISTVYEHLIGTVLNTPTWNFCKYLVDRNGEVVQFFKEKDSFVNIRQSLDYLISRTHTEL